MAEFFFVGIHKTKEGEKWEERERRGIGEGDERERRESGQSSKNRGEKSTHKKNEATQRYKGDGEVENIRGKSLV